MVSSPAPSGPRLPALDARAVSVLVVALGMRWALERTDFEAPQWWAVGLILGGIAAAALALRSERAGAWLALAHATLVGLAERLSREPFQGSDVMRATREAIDVIMRGGDPYTHFFRSTIPQGSPFAYPPGEPLFYAVTTTLSGIDIFEIDRAAGLMVTLLIAALALAVGPMRAALAQALWSTSMLAAYRAVDGSNDTGLTLLFVLGTVLLAGSLHRRSTLLLCASALAFGWALAFKQLAWLVYPSVAVFLRRTHPAWKLHAAIALATGALMMAPLALRSLPGFMQNVVGAASIHENVWGLNVWAALAGHAPEAVDAIAPGIPRLAMLLTLLALGWAVLRPQADLGRALLQGTGVLALALLAARWTTSPYYVFALAVLALSVASFGLRPRASADPTTGTPA